MSKKRTKALHPSKETLAVIGERDRYQCVFCGSTYQLTQAHYISRAQGGLGIPENLAIVCMDCHYKMDHTTDRQEFLQRFRDYLDSHYPNFTGREYKKWSDRR